MDGQKTNTYSKVVLDGEYGISLQINSMDYFNHNEYDAIISGITSCYIMKNLQYLIEIHL
jgi:hypothetical protein